MLLAERVQAGSPCSASSVGVLVASEMQCIRGKLKEGSEFKCQSYVNQQTDIEECWPGIELNGQSLKMGLDV